MRITTIRTAQATAAARVDADKVIEIDGYREVGELLGQADWQQIAAAANGTAHDPAQVERATLISNPSKVICVGLNYRNHILEMGRELPQHPTLFAKFADTLTAPYADIVAVDDDPALDWEGELAVVIGREAYRVDASDAADHIAGYAVANDVSMRGWQNRTLQWLQGKMWVRSTPIGPDLVSADAFVPATETLSTRVNGVTVQQEQLSDLLFDPADLIAYISRITPLRPGDIILTGTPGGVGHARQPAQYLRAGDNVEVDITGLGTLRNTLIADA